MWGDMPRGPGAPPGARMPGMTVPPSPGGAAGTSRALDLDFVRSFFPALETPWVLLDNAGGAATARQVIERVTEHMTRRPVQLGASYDLSVEAQAAVDGGRAAVAKLLGADPDEVVLGASTTTLMARLARALRPLWDEGDEVVVTDLDHEANGGPWRRLEETGIVVREWKLREETARLEVEDLEPLLGPRTRLVAFTQTANVVGDIHDAKAAVERIHAAGALACVDGVAYAAHRRVDVRALDADFYSVALYKVFGPHLGALFGKRDLLREARGQNHFFYAEDAVPGKFEPGNAPYELVAGSAGIVAYLEELARHHGGATLDDAYARIAAHEEELARPLLAWLAEHPRITIHGSPRPDADVRVPTVAFSVQGLTSGEVVAALGRHHVAARYGHFYAPRAMDRFGLPREQGVVRVSLVHYNSPEEVGRLVAALDEELGASGA